MNVEKPTEIDLAFEKLFSFIKNIPDEISRENEGDFIRLTNGIQIYLSIKKYGDGDENFDKWQKEYSKHFRVAFENLLDDENEKDTEYNIFYKLSTNPENLKKIIEKIEEILYA